MSTKSENMERRAMLAARLPAPVARVAHKASSAVVYAYTDAKSGKPSGVYFSGAKGKPDYHYRFPSEAKREEYSRGFFEGVAEREANKRQRETQTRTLEVGDILRASWGYDQTNVDYYEIVNLVGKSSVQLCKIESRNTEEDGGWTGKSVPVPGAFASDPFVKRTKGDSVKIASYAYARKMTPQGYEEDGTPIYAPTSWTAYA